MSRCAALNPSLVNEIGEHLTAINREGITILLIEHDMALIRRLCDPVIVMANGAVMAEGASRRSPPGRMCRKPIWEAALTILSVEGAVAGYSREEQILKGASLHVSAGEIVSIIGPNGAGNPRCSRPLRGC